MYKNNIARLHFERIEFFLAIIINMVGDGANIVAADEGKRVSSAVGLKKKNQKSYEKHCAPQKQTPTVTHVEIMRLNPTSLGIESKL